MTRQLLSIALITVVTGVLGLLYQQRGMQASVAAMPTDSSSDLLHSMRVRLAQMEARAAHAEERATRAEKLASTLTPASAATATPAVHAQSSNPPLASQVATHSPMFIHSINSLPARPGELMMMTYATGGVHEMLYNWVLHVQRLGLPELVAAMDRDVVAKCSEQFFHCLDWSHTATGADKAYVRGSFDGFRALGVRKLDALLPVLRAGIHVVLSDVDCVWSMSPLPMFHGQLKGYEDFARADVLVATDCMSPEDDELTSGCYFDTVDKNTGVLAVRATPNGIATMAEWQVRLAVGQKDEQDQTTFNDLLDGNGRGHRWGMDFAQRSQFSRFAAAWCGQTKLRRGINSEWTSSTRGGGATVQHVEGSRRIYRVCLPNVTRDALVGVFPITAVAGGHTFFVQQLQSPTGRWPMAVHATYQFGDQIDYPFGKRQRFRDWGMWLADDASEMITSGNYLVLEDDEPPPPRKDWVGYADLHVRGRQHVDQLQHIRQRLAYGFMLARVLNRTVVLPTLWCYCDKFWHRLHQCAINTAHTSQPLPFVCPLDHVLDPTWFHGTERARRARPRKGMLAPRADGPWEDGLPFRGRHWLRQLGAHPSVALASATLSTRPAAEGSKTYQVVPELLKSTRTAPTSLGRTEDEARAKIKHAFAPGSERPHIQMPVDQTDVQLRGALQLYEHIRLMYVSLTDAAALLSCYERPQEASDARSLTSLLFQHEWCYRPIEMTSEWMAVDRRGKPRRGDEPWCVWGFKTPQVRQKCSR